MQASIDKVLICPFTDLPFITVGQIQTRADIHKISFSIYFPVQNNNFGKPESSISAVTQSHAILTKWKGSLAPFLRVGLNSRQKWSTLPCPSSDKG